MTAQTPKRPSKQPTKIKQGSSKKAAEDRRQAFIDAYIENNGNATQAAKAAGFSEKTCRQQAARLLSHVAVKAEISKRAEKIAKKYELTAELAAKTIYQELTFDPCKLYDENGKLRDLDKLDVDTRMALSAVEFEQHGSADAPITVRKVKWNSRAAAREQLMKHLGMFEADNKQRSTVTLINLAGRDE